MEATTEPAWCEACDAPLAGCPHHPDYDPTPWCNGCGAETKTQCDCGPRAEND